MSSCSGAEHLELPQAVAVPGVYSLQQAMQADGSAYDGRFIYNGKIFKLHAAKRRDAKTGEDLRKKGITLSADSITGIERQHRE